MLGYIALGLIGGGAGRMAWDWLHRRSAPGQAPASTLALSAAPPPVSGEWARWAAVGARPEPRGWPEDTILAAPGVEALDAAGRKAALDVCGELGLPIDSLAAVIASESGWQSWAINGVQRDKDGRPRRSPDGKYLLTPENADRVAAGKAPFYAVGLCQLTLGANLPGFTSNEELLAIAEWSAARQLRDVVRPFYARVPKARGATPGQLRMLTFVPADAGKPQDFAVGERGADGLRAAIYRGNQGLDSNKDDKITIAEVEAATMGRVKAANGKRVTIDGRVIAPPRGPAKVAPAAAPARVGPAVPAASSPSSAPAVPAKEAAAVTPAVTEVQSSSTTAMPPGPAAPQVVDQSAIPRVSRSGPAGGLLLAAVKAGREEPPTFVEVPWQGGSATGKLSLTLRVSAHALRARVLVDGQERLLRLPVSYRDTIEICRLKGLLPPTKSMVDAIWNAAKHLMVRPLGTWPDPADKSAAAKALAAKTSKEMVTIDYVVRHNEYLDAQIGDAWAKLCRDEGKYWILDDRATGTGAVNYGWKKPPDGKPVQPVGGAHDWNHYDYSQVMHCVQRKARDASGAEVDLVDVLRRAGMPAAVLAPFGGGAHQ